MTPYVSTKTNSIVEEDTYKITYLLNEKRRSSRNSNKTRQNFALTLNIYVSRSFRTWVHCNLFAYERHTVDFDFAGICVDFRRKRQKQTIINETTTQNSFCTNKTVNVCPSFCRVIQFFRKLATMVELCRNVWTMNCLCSPVGIFDGCRWGSEK